MNKASTQIIGLVIAMLISGEIVLAQQNESMITVDITKDVNGKQEKFEKTYRSTEEMEADEELKAFTEKSGKVNYGFSGSGNKTIRINQSDTLPEGYAFDFDSEVNKVVKKMKGYNDLDDDSLSVVLNAKIRKLENALANMGMDIVEEIEILKEMDWDEIKERHKIMLIDDQQEKVIISEDDRGRKLTISDDEGLEFGKKGSVAEKDLLIIPELDYFPNPSSGRFRLRFELEEPGPLNVKVYNIEGQEVYVRYFPRFSGRFSETIDLSGQANGMYLLELSHHKKRLIRKVVIQ